MNFNLNPQSRLFTIAGWPYFSYGFSEAAVCSSFPRKDGGVAPLRPSTAFPLHSPSLFSSYSELPLVHACLAFSVLRDFSLCSLCQEILLQTPPLRAYYPPELACCGKPYFVLLPSCVLCPSLPSACLVLCGMLSLPLVTPYWE